MTKLRSVRIVGNSYQLSGGRIRVCAESVDVLEEFHNKHLRPKPKFKFDRKLVQKAIIVEDAL